MKKPIISVLCLFLLLSATAQELSKADYARAVSFLWPNLANKKVFNLSVQVNWFPDSTGFSFVTNTANEKAFNKFVFKEMKVSRFFDHTRLAKVLADTLKTTFNPAALPFNAVNYVDKSTIEFNVNDKPYRIDLNSWTLKQKRLKRTMTLK